MKIHMGLLQKHYQWTAVCAIYENLRAHGHQAYLAGGCVRDAILGRAPKDLDLATSATPEMIEELFPRTVAVGKAFGVMRVLTEGADVEVATFRRDGEYQDGRRPETVIFSTAEEDVQRRDFTINALLMDPGVEAILDYVEGQKDLERGLIRTVGDPEKRFAEDYLRILRAIRFSGQLGFEIEDKTFEAIQKAPDRVLEVSAERQQEEMTKLLSSEFLDLALHNLKSSGLLQVLFPFRGDDISFLKIPADQNWKRWSLFYLPLLEKEDPLSFLKKNLEHLRFSNRDKKNIQRSFEILTNPLRHFRLRDGERFIAYDEEAVRWAYQILSFQGSVYQDQIEFDHRRWLALEKMPESFLRGQDLLGLVQGVKLGELLERSYLLQLEGQLKSREEALRWLQETVKEKS